MKNSEIAGVFSDMADLLELKGEDRFKVIAYQKAARAIELLPEDAEKMAAEGRLREIRGVGEAIEKKIAELVTTGKLTIYENLKKEFPEGISNLLDIPGVGPRTAAQLTRELGIKTVDELERAIIDGKVAGLYRMGDKTAENILHQIQALRRKKTAQRIPIGEALAIVDEITAQLKDVPGLKNLVAAGSIRRFNETIGDIDLMGTADDPARVIEAFTKLTQVKEVRGSGTTKASIVASNGRQVDLRLVEHEAFGSLLQYFTGSKQHNVSLRERARRIGLSLSEYGITDLKTGNLEKFATEEAFYKRQGLQYIPPEIREDTDEIELAEKGKVPRLIEQSDIMGDLHMHSKWTDGRDTIEEMALAAKKMGYKYIAISDHSVGRGIARGLDRERLLKQVQEIKALREKIEGIYIFTGIEVDIRSDGSMDFPDELLKGLDIVTASVHSGLNQPRETMTARLIRALENPNVDILAHLTTRQIPDREAAELDIEAVFKAAKKTGTLLEINAMPTRLDLKDTHIYRARDLGVNLVINTDAHQTDHLTFMRFGVGIARRGWCRDGDIFNTRSLKDVRQYVEGRG